MLKLIIAAALFVIVGAEYQSYHPRGWRPSGHPFEPTRNDRLQTYDRQSLPQSYGYPIKKPSREPLSTTTIETPRTTSTTENPTSTPRSREPTTSPDILDQDYDTSPALAVANSFAFNRPVYVYNTFPFHSGLTFVK